VGRQEGGGGGAGVGGGGGGGGGGRRARGTRKGREGDREGTIEVERECGEERRVRGESR